MSSAQHGMRGAYYATPERSLPASRRPKVDRWLLVCLAVLLALAPLPFGSARPWATAAVALAVGGIGLIAALAAWRKTPSATEPPVPVSLWLVVPFAMVCMHAALQSALAVPQGMAHPVWAMARDTAIDNLAMTISANPAAGLEAVMRLLAMGVAFLLARRLAQSQRRARQLVTALALISGAYSFYGILAHISGSETILWLERWSHQGSLSGTFVSRNSHAVFAGLGLLCCVAAITAQVARIARPDDLMRERVVSVLEIAGPLLAVVAAALLCNLVALVLTQSRAGTASSALALLVLIGLLWRGSRRRRGANLVVLGLVAVVALYAVLAGGGLFERLAGTDIATNERMEVYRATLRAIADRPLLGHGLAAFEDVFHLYRTSGMPSNWAHDHNTYLGMAMELGIPAAALMLFVFAALAFRLARHSGRKTWMYPLPALGLTALVLVGANALLDFSIEIPAIGLMLACILGAADGRARRAGDRHGR